MTCDVWRRLRCVSFVIWFFSFDCYIVCSHDTKPNSTSHDQKRHHATQLITNDSTHHTHHAVTLVQTRLYTAQTRPHPLPQQEDHVNSTTPSSPQHLNTSTIKQAQVIHNEIHHTTAITKPPSLYQQHTSTTSPPLHKD